MSPVMAARHYSGLFKSLDVASRWDHEDNATVSDPKIMLYYICNCQLADLCLLLFVPQLLWVEGRDTRGVITRY